MILRSCLMITLLFVRCVAQSPTLNRSDFEVSGGRIFGAALTHTGSIFYTQQYLAEIDNYGAEKNVVRISAWDTSGKLRLATESYPEAERGQNIPCRRTLLGPSSGHLYVCSDRTYIRILNGKTLTTIRTVQVHTDGTIRDFAIDESRDRLYLLADHSNGMPTITEVRLSTGASVNEATLTYATFAYSPLAYQPESSLLVVASARTGGFGQKADLIFYSAITLQVIKRIDDFPRIDGLLFVGSKLLAAPGYLGYRKEDCLLSVDLHTFEKGKDFCAPKTGVDFSVASVGNSYLVAATGINRPKLFSDIIESVSSSISVWSIETKRLVKTLSLPSGFTSALSGVSLLGSPDGCFVAYQSSGISSSVISACIDNDKNDPSRPSLSRTSPK